jgi:predicted dehydrogenase
MTRPYRVLIVGVGSIGERHLRCFQKTDRCELIACEVNDKLRAEIQQRYPAARAHATLEDALADGPDVAVIATPAPLHLAQATRLVEAGAHVLIEKPLCTTLDGLADLRTAIARTGKTVGVAYVYRVFPALAAMRAALHSGRFGKPVQLVAVGGQHFPTYRPAYRTIYYNNRATGGGAIQDALTHILNAGEWLVGPIDRLVADAAHQVLDGVTVEDTAHVLTRQGSVLGSYSLNQYQAPNEISFTVVGERGTVRYDVHRGRWMWQTDPTPGTKWTEEPGEMLDRDGPFVLQAHAFLDAVEGKRPIPCSLDEGVQTLRVNLAALASLESQTWQAIQPITT